MNTKSNRERERLRKGIFETQEYDGGVAQKSVEGWIVFGEVLEDDLLDKFSEYGDVTQIQVGLDRRTGNAKGYALIGFGEFEEAEKAIKEGDGDKMNEVAISVDWAFKPPPK